MSTPSADPWFQTLFADRMGGANYGKGTEIYKFEKIKRAKRAVLQAHPERQLLDFGIGENDDMADPLVREALKREVDKIDNRGYADNGIQAFKDAAAAFMKKQFGVADRPGHGGQPRHRLQAGPGHVARRVHQPRRRDPDDRARLSGGRHAHQILRRRGLQPTAAGSEWLLSRLRCHSRRHSQARQADGHQLPQQPHRAPWRRATFSAR